MALTTKNIFGIISKEVLSLSILGTRLMADTKTKIILHLIFLHSDFTTENHNYNN